MGLASLDSGANVQEVPGQGGRRNQGGAATEPITKVLIREPSFGAKHVLLGCLGSLLLSAAVRTKSPQSKNAIVLPTREIQR